MTSNDLREKNTISFCCGKEIKVSIAAWKIKGSKDLQVF